MMQVWPSKDQRKEERMGKKEGRQAGPPTLLSFAANTNCRHLPFKAHASPSVAGA